MIPSPSIHSASVVDALSGMCVTEPALSTSHLDPVEVGSYQRFDTFRRENSRANFAEAAQCRLATQTEVEAVYKQATDKMSRSGGTFHSRTGSDASNVTKFTVPAQSISGSAFSISVVSETDITQDSDSPLGLQISPDVKHDLSKSKESGDSVINEDIAQLHGQVVVKLSGDGKVSDESVNETLQFVIHPDNYSIATSPGIVTQTVQEANTVVQDDVISVTQPESDVSVPLIEVEPTLRGELDIHEINFPGEASKVTSQGKAENMLALINVPTSLGEEASQDSNGVTMHLLESRHHSGKEVAVEESQDVNEILELVRIPPPPTIPRTGQLVTLETGDVDDHDLRNTVLAEAEGSLVSHASLSEITLDTCQNDLHDKEVNCQNTSSKPVSPTRQKNRLHVAVVDQLNLLSERLEAVAARQIQEEEEAVENGEALDQRPVFSPASQSLPLTPLYSANHSVPLTPACAWSSFVNTPAPTPLQTQTSAFYTSAATPVPTPRTQSHSVSGVFNLASDIQTPNAIHTQNSSDGVFDICSPALSQDAASRHRSRCSSFSEVGQEFVLNEWSHLDAKDTQRPTEAFPSKPSSGTDSSIANASRSVGDLNSVSEPIDIIGTMAKGSYGGHLNSPENSITGPVLESPLPNCLPQLPILPSVNVGNPFQGAEPEASETQKRAGNVQSTMIQETSQAAIVEEKRNIHGEIPAWSPQQTALQNIKVKDDSNEHQFHQSPTEFKPRDRFSGSSSGFVETSEQEQTDFLLGATDDPKPPTHLDFILVESKLNPFLESDQTESTEVSQQVLSQENEVCSTVGDTDESVKISISDSTTVPIQLTQLRSNPAESKLNPFLDSVPKETTSFSQQINYHENKIFTTVGDPDDSKNNIIPASIAVPVQPAQSESNPVESKLNLFSDSVPKETIQVSQQSSFQGNEVCSTLGDPDECQIHSRLNSIAELNLNPFLDSVQNDSTVVSQQIASQVNVVCPRVVVLDELNYHTTSDSIDIPTQETRLVSNPVKSKLLLDSEEWEYKEPDRKSTYQDSERITLYSSEGSQDVPSSNPDPLSDEVGSKGGQRQSYYHATGLSNDPGRCMGARDNSTFSSPKSENNGLSLQAGDSHSQPDKTEHLDGKQLTLQNHALDKNVEPHEEESKIELTEHRSVPNPESDHMLNNLSNWTTFSHSEEALIFEIETESEPSSHYNENLETEPMSSSSNTKNGNQDCAAVTVDQPVLFPPLQIFSDIVDDMVKSSRLAVPQKLPPPPRQVLRKRTDIAASMDTGHLRSHNAPGNEVQGHLEETAYEGKSLEESHKKSTQNQSLAEESQVCSVCTDADLSVTGSSLTEIDQNQDPCPSQLSDNSVAEVACEEFEFTESDDVLTELDDYNLDDGLSKISINNDIAPLLMQSEEPIHYLNLRDLAEDSQVLQKQSSTTSSTDDSSISSTSTDSSLSENEMPYSKLHEDFSDSLEHG